MPGINGYKVLYVLIHSLYVILEIILNIGLYIFNKLFKYSGFWSVKNETDQFHKRLCKLSKKPNHLTVILGDECSYKDVANLICWCLSTEILFISFYDYKGNLKKQDDKLRIIVDSVKVLNDHIIWHSEAGMQHKNGFQGRKIHVKLLTEEDGKETIVNVTKNLALSKQRDISIEKLNICLKEHFEFPDPDMGLVFGKTLNILNYPPWQIRLTEFFKINSGNNITFSTFLEQLEKFSNCQQRQGK